MPPRPPPTNSVPLEPETALAGAPFTLTAQRASASGNYCGWVFKQSDWLKCWRRRWLVLWTRPPQAGGGSFLLSYSSAIASRPRPVSPIRRLAQANSYCCSPSFHALACSSPDDEM